MNTSRTDFNFILDPKCLIDSPTGDYWLLGFIEAEGSFTLSFNKLNQLKPIVKISQKLTSLVTLQAIGTLFSHVTGT
jgi:hypothetical protein